MELVLVNGQGLTETYGWTLEEGNYPQLLRAPKLKPSYTYSWPNADGEDYDPTAVPAKECQDFTLSFLIVAETKEELLIKYESFMNVLLDPAGTDWQFLEINKAFRLHFVDAVDWTDVDIYSGSARVSVTLRNRFVVPKTTPNAPTAMVFDANDRTIDFTFNPEYTDLYDYEYTLDGGATWNVLAVKPIQLTISSYPVKTIGVRIAESGSTYASSALWNANAIEGDVIWGFVNSVTVGGYTFDEGLLRESWDALPLQITEGVTLVPYAYKTGVVGLIDNETGAVVDGLFARATTSNYWAFDGKVKTSPINVVSVDFKINPGFNILPAYSSVFRFSHLQNTTGLNEYKQLVATGWELGEILDEGLMMDNSVNTQTTNNQSFIHQSGAYTLRFYIQRADGQEPLVGPPFSDTDVIVYIKNAAYDGDYKKRLVGAGVWEISIDHEVDEPTSYNVRLAKHVTQYRKSPIVVTGMEVITPRVDAAPLYVDNAAMTVAAESLQIPLSATTDIWLKYADHEGNIIEQVIEDVPSGNFNVHDQITNGKLLALIAPMRKFTGAERSVLND